LISALLAAVSFEQLVSSEMEARNPAIFVKFMCIPV
jgi:hypothetical protein